MRGAQRKKAGAATRRPRVINNLGSYLRNLPLDLPYRVALPALRYSLLSRWTKGPVHSSEPFATENSLLPASPASVVESEICLFGTFDLLHFSLLFVIPSPTTSRLDTSLREPPRPFCTTLSSMLESSPSDFSAAASGACLGSTTLRHPRGRLVWLTLWWRPRAKVHGISTLDSYGRIFGARKLPQCGLTSPTGIANYCR